MSTMRAAASAVLLLLGAASAAAQPGPNEQARGLLEDGRAYLKAGQTKQAVDNFNTIVSGFAGTDSVDDALLEIGRWRMDVEGNPEAARAAFEDVTKRFPQSDGAPGAYYHLGRLALARATTTAELDDALAQFVRVQRLYPGSEWVPRALHGAALVHRKAGRLADAVESARRVALEYPNSEAAPEAYFEAGHALALMGEPRPAMEELQQIRNRFPGSEWAPRALERVTALYRLYGGASPAFAPDPAFSLGAGDVLKDVRALLVTQDGQTWIASDKVKGVVPFGRDGKMGSSLTGVDLRSLSTGPRGELVVAAKLAVRIGPRDIRSFSVPGDKPGVPEPLERIEAALLTPGGHVLVADGKQKRVYRFDGRFQFKDAFPDAREREVTRMTLDPDGGLVFLDREARTITTYDETGKLLRTLPARGAGYELRKPVDVAVDPFRQTYVADQEGAVLVFSPQGKLLATLGGSGARPTALTLDATGAVLVYDDKSERVVRYR
jgi:TolA-binding protein